MALARRCRAIDVRDAVGDSNHRMELLPCAQPVCSGTASMHKSAALLLSLSIRGVWVVCKTTTLPEVTTELLEQQALPRAAHCRRSCLCDSRPVEREVPLVWAVYARFCMPCDVYGQLGP